MTRDMAERSRVKKKRIKIQDGNHVNIMIYPSSDAVITWGSLKDHYPRVIQGRKFSLLDVSQDGFDGLLLSP